MILFIKYDDINNYIVSAHVEVEMCSLAVVMYEFE